MCAWDVDYVGSQARRPSPRPARGRRAGAGGRTIATRPWFRRFGCDRRRRCNARYGSAHVAIFAPRRVRPEAAHSGAFDLAAVAEKRRRGNLGLGGGCRGGGLAGVVRGFAGFGAAMIMMLVLAACSARCWRADPVGDDR